jgi:hypothetical protein
MAVRRSFRWPNRPATPADTTIEYTYPTIDPPIGVLLLSVACMRYGRVRHDMHEECIAVAYAPPISPLSSSKSKFIDDARWN